MIFFHFLIDSLFPYYWILSILYMAWIHVFCQSLLFFLSQSEAYLFILLLHFTEQNILFWLSAIDYFPYGFCF